MNNPTQKIEGKDWITLPWIFSSNLNLFVEYATHLGNYACDSSDTVALEYGISQSTYEQAVWFEYSFAGNNKLELSFALDVGTDVLFVRCKANAELVTQIHTLATIMG